MSKKDITTESLPLNKKFIDKMSDNDAISFLLMDHVEAAQAVKKSHSKIQKASLAIYNHLKASDYSRLIYVGAGTSGRLGVQDGIELIPTFGWESNRIDFIIAGGKDALIKSIENAEDDEKNAKIKVINKKIKSKDVLIAISASGNTPFTISVIKEARKTGALTIGISNNKDSVLNDHVDFSIILLTGAEAVAGSTRLKAGTAQKICLNTISTFIMTKIGKVKNGRMTNLMPMNKKLRKRLELINKDQS